MSNVVKVAFNLRPTTYAANGWDQANGRIGLRHGFALVEVYI
jgi:hypothetical protein